MLKSEMRALYEKAKAAGMAAGVAAIPVPMAVSGGVPGEPAKLWVEPEGACGFAWVKIRPGNSPFANWLKKNDIASKAYGGWVDIWIGDFNQSIARKEACARAMAKVLSEGGINAYADSRLD